MNVLKLGFISLIVFALLITIISFFFPSHVRISKAIDIETSKNSLHIQLSDLSKWKNWYPGADTMVLTSDPRDGVGLGNNNGGRIHIKSVTDSTVTAFTTGSSVRNAKMGWNIFEGGRPNTVTVQWYMDFHLSWYPWEKFSSLLLEKRYGPVMEKGLDKLKKLLEKQVER